MEGRFFNWFLRKHKSFKPNDGWTYSTEVRNFHKLLMDRTCQVQVKVGPNQVWSNAAAIDMFPGRPLRWRKRNASA